MIPTNRPVLGRDLEDVKLNFGLSTADTCWLLGMSMTKWTQLKNKPDVPVTDTTLALLIRLLDQHPELPVMPAMPDASEMYELLNTSQKMDLRRFAILMGSESSAGYRWLNGPSRRPPAMQRLMFYMRMVLMGARSDDRQRIVAEWIKTVSEEAQARGVQDIFKAGRWTLPKPKGIRAAKSPATRGVGRMARA